MMEHAQPIRPTQFVTTYGPGAVLETLRGPRLIVGIADSGLFDRDQPSDYEIKEPALSQLLPEQGRIFRLPSNADFDLEDGKAIYNTQPFPKWSLCPTHSRLYRAKYKSRKACPECPTKSEGKAWEQAREQAVSFVMACPEGHLDDVPWSFFLHRATGKNDCRPDTIEWSGAGGPLNKVVLRCPKCKAEARLSDLYHQEHTCAGRYLEQGDREFAPCAAKARISQRAASDLHLPEVRTALTLPEVDSPLHTALRDDSVFPAVAFQLRLKTTLSEDDWNATVELPNVRPSVKEVILDATLEQRLDAARRVLRESQPRTDSEARAEEFQTLQKASSGDGLRSPNFELDRAAARELPLGPLTLRVTPVSRLRLVAAQIGYRRLGGKVVETGFRHLSHLWFPGVEQFGEGLFLELVSPLSSKGPNWRAWQQRLDAEGHTADHPVLVWWHTLSHRLIRALSVDSGYSAASVRERLYLDREQGGLLIYAVQPGGDGTLGGLIALVPHFERILRVAIANLDGCSNDPLCGEQKVSATRQSGAACYACSLLSETSCEMRNHSLDRRILLETLGES